MGFDAIQAQIARNFDFFVNLSFSPYGHVPTRMMAAYSRDAVNVSLSDL